NGSHGASCPAQPPLPRPRDERDFVLDLRAYYEHHAPFFAARELYLLRNMSRGRGIGFFEAGNFYPDFILWLVSDGAQRIAFVDPKGIRNLEGLNDPKIRFHQTIKELEARLADPTVRLSSFIIAVTPHQQGGFWGAGFTKAELEANNVLFQHDDNSTYIETMLNKLVAGDACP
ncbi:MAG: restriction endonuclease subunit R, partial [Anaerolineae bacterium]|nr:restriction endonuclease subunit R [Anaerolineae bacterium]